MLLYFRPFIWLRQTLNGLSRLKNGNDDVVIILEDMKIWCVAWSDVMLSIGCGVGVDCSDPIHPSAKTSIHFCLSRWWHCKYVFFLALHRKFLTKKIPFSKRIHFQVEIIFNGNIRLFKLSYENFSMLWGSRAFRM